MKQFLNVQGSQEIVNEIEFNVDTVYVRSNIQRIETEDFAGWQYDEKQYGIREYLELISGNQIKQNEQLLSADEKYKLIDKSSISLDNLKLAKLAQLDELCNKSIVDGFDCDINGISYHFSCSTNAQLNFTGTQYKFDKGEITSIEWTAIENTTGNIVRITLDATSFKIVADKVLPHINGNINKLRNILQPQVESATDNTSVDSIVW